MCGKNKCYGFARKVGQSWMLKPKFFFHFFLLTIYFKVCTSNFLKDKKKVFFNKGLINYDNFLKRLTVSNPDPVFNFHSALIRFNNFIQINSQLTWHFRALKILILKKTKITMEFYDFCHITYMAAGFVLLTNHCITSNKI